MSRSASTADGLKLAVYDLGGEGADLLMCHAAGLHGLVWSPLAERLRDRFHCWSIDFRAHGASQRPSSGELPWSRFADDALSAVEVIGAEQIIALGHSMGATALLIAAATRPEAFHRLLCFEPIVNRTPLDSDAIDETLIRSALRRRSRFLSYDDAVSFYATRLPYSRWDRAAVAAYVEHGFELMPDGSVTLRCRPEDQSTVYATANEHDCYKLLPLIHCDVVVAFGSESRLLSEEKASLLATSMPRGGLLRVDGMSHFGPLEGTEAMKELVVRTLS